MKTVGKMSLLIVACLVAAMAPAGAARAQSGIKAQLAGSGFSAPVGIYSIPGDTNRLFIVQQGGLIRILDLTTGMPLATPFLNVSSTGLNRISTASERGLLGLAFDPNYTTNGRFYVYYTAITTGAVVIERFTATGAPFANQAAALAAATANTSSGLVMLSITHSTNNNHNGGSLLFGTDGMLYAGVGDGGGGNDFPENAQNLDVLLGKILRLDVNDSSSGDGDALYVPDDNPFRSFGGSIRPYIWAYGMRNPWRIDRDRLTGDLWIGDVGQDTQEEIDFQPKHVPGVGGNTAIVGGRNYGWDCREGLIAAPGSPATDPDPDFGCDATAGGYIDPVKVYLHAGDLACSVTGGVVYRGAAMPAFQGVYFHADYCGNWARSFRLNGAGTGYTDLRDWTAQLNRGTSAVNGVVDFGEDAAGEVYFASVTTGNIWKIVPDTTDCGCPCTLSGHQNLLFSDNGETDQGWTTSVVGATDGPWERGIPNTPSTAVDPVCDSDGSGSCWLTDNANENSDVDNGSVVLTSRQLDFTAGNITICYDYYTYLAQTGGTSPDGLFVEVSSNNGSSWTRVASHTSQNLTGWLSNSITHTQLQTAGVAYTSTMRLRFIASDNSSPGQSVVECGVDAIRIYSLDTCPCDYDANIGKDADDLFAFLDDWFAQNGQNGSGLPADFNLSGGVDADDLFAFLDCWFAPCP